MDISIQRQDRDDGGRGEPSLTDHHVIIVTHSSSGLPVGATENNWNRHRKLLVRIYRDPGRVVRVAAEPARGAAEGEHHHEQDRLLGRGQQAEDDVLQGDSVQRRDIQ